MRNKIMIQTNSKTGSQKTITLKPLMFDELWKAYPSSAVKHIDKATGKDVISDHCAIHVSEAFYKCKVPLSVSAKERCWCCPTADSKGNGIHFLRAQELSNFLSKKPFFDCPEPIVLTGKNYEATVTDKTGIIFFQDYWQRSGEKERSGDHIDLWKNNELASLGWTRTFIRRTFPSFSEEYLSMSDLRKSKKVLFWALT